MNANAPKGMKLVNRTTGKTMQVGDKVTLHGGDEAILNSMEMPHHAGSTGRVYVETSDGNVHSYFPGVVDAEWRVDE